MAAMPRYELRTDAWLPIGNDGGSILCKAGETIAWDGWPGAYMEPKNDLAETMKAALEEMRASGRDLPSIEVWKREQAARRKVRDQV
jgi:hypothetical protein